MKQLFKITVLPALFLLLTVNSTNAAFPKEKKGRIEVNLKSDKPGNNEISENPINKSQLKKELKELTNSNSEGQGGSGSKSKVLAAILALFLGGFGIHRFYMGQKKQGFMQLGGTLVGIGLYVAGIASFVSGTGAAIPVVAIIGAVLLLGVSIWAFVDFIRILTGGLAPEEGFND